MDLFSSIEQALEDHYKRAKECGEKISTYVNGLMMKAQEDGEREYGQIEQTALRKANLDAVKSFYDDYTPNPYFNYQRNFSLYNLLDYKTDKYGRVDIDVNYIDWFDKSKITRDRHGGDSLFETVFIEGWHGGARGIRAGLESNWGAHPAPGDAYYRKPGVALPPGEDSPRHHKWGVWGAKAARSASAYDVIAETFGPMLSNELDQKHTDILNAYQQNAIPQHMDHIRAIANRYGFI